MDSLLALRFDSEIDVDRFECPSSLTLPRGRWRAGRSRYLNDSPGAYRDNEFCLDWSWWKGKPLDNAVTIILTKAKKYSLLKIPWLDKCEVLIMESRSLIAFDRYQSLTHTTDNTRLSSKMPNGPQSQRTQVSLDIIISMYIINVWGRAKMEVGSFWITLRVIGDLFVLKGKAVFFSSLWLSLVLVPLWAFGWASMVTHFGRLRQTLWMFYEVGFWKNGASTMTFSEWVSEKLVGYLKM